MKTPLADTLAGVSAADVLEAGRAVLARGPRLADAALLAFAESLAGGVEPGFIGWRRILIAGVKDSSSEAEGILVTLRELQGAIAARRALPARVDGGAHRERGRRELLRLQREVGYVDPMTPFVLAGRSLHDELEHRRELADQRVAQAERQLERLLNDLQTWSVA